MTAARRLPDWAQEPLDMEEAPEEYQDADTRFRFDGREWNEVPSGPLQGGADGRN